MATIADNLNTLQVIKLDIKDAIISKGGTASDDFRTYANAIEELPSGGGDDTLGQLLKNELTTYSIPNGITALKNYQFAGETGLTSVTIPNSVSSIGQNVFSACTKLVQLRIGNGFVTISSGFCSNCTSLTSVTIPNSVSTIEANAFYVCSSLTSVTIPNSVCYLGSAVFQSTKKLTDVYCGWLIPPTQGAIFSSSYTGGTLHVPEGASQYYRQKWTGTTAPLGTTLKWNIVEDMGEYKPTRRTIARYNVTSTTTPTKIFAGNNKLASGATSAATGCVIWIENTPSMFSGSGYTFSEIGLKEVIIDNWVENKNNRPFNSLTDLVEIELDCNSIGYNDFNGCVNLTNVTITDSVKDISSNNGLSPKILKYNSSYPFREYFGKNLENVTLGNSVTSIEQNAFSNCSSLTSVTIGSSVTSIGKYAFAGCSSLTDITYNGTKAQFTSITKSNIWKNGIPSTCIIHCTDGDYPITDFD